MDILFEIKDNGLYYQDKLVGNFANPSIHRDAIRWLVDLLDCAYHPLTKWFIAEAAKYEGEVKKQAANKVCAWKNGLIKSLAKPPYCNMPFISENVGDNFNRSCVVEWYRVFGLDYPLIENYKRFSHDDVEQLIEAESPKEFLCIEKGSDEELEGFTDGMVYDLLDVANRSFEGEIQGDYVTMRFVRDEPFIKIVDRDLALRVFNPVHGEWTKLMRHLSDAAVVIKHELLLLASIDEDDEDMGDEDNE